VTEDKKKSGWRKEFTRNLNRNFLTGLLVATPTVVAAWVLYSLFIWVDGILWEDIRFGWLREGGIPGVGAVTVLLLVVLIGIMVNNYLGRRFYGLWESLVVRIPLFNKIYLAVKQIGESLLAGDRTVFRAVGLIEYPRRGIWCLVFVTERPGEEIREQAKTDLRSVFLPTTPNPTSGFLLMLPEEDIHFLSMTVEDGLKMVISGGAFVPSTVEAVKAEDENRRGFRFWRRRPRDDDSESEAADTGETQQEEPSPGESKPGDGSD